jgi:hypothetical protein
MNNPGNVLWDFALARNPKEQKEKSSALPKANCLMSPSTKQGHPKVTKEGLFNNLGLFF